MKCTGANSNRPVCGRGAVGGILPGPAGRPVPAQAGGRADVLASHAVRESPQARRSRHQSLLPEAVHLERSGDPGRRACGACAIIRTPTTRSGGRQGSSQGRESEGSLGPDVPGVFAARRCRRTCSRKRWKSTRTTPRLCTGWLWCDATPSRRCRGARRKSAEDRSQAVSRRASCWRASRSKTTIRRRPSKKPRRRSTSRAKRWTRCRFWRPSIGWTTSPARNGSTGFSRSIRHMAKRTPPPGISSSSTAATTKASSITARRWRSKPDLWSARAELGVNLMRFGQNEEARQNLEACFNANYSSPLVRNTLRLLDSSQERRDVHHAHHGSEARQERSRAAAAVLPGGARSRHGDLREEVQVSSSRAGAAGGLSQPSRISKFAPWACRDWARWA